MAAARDDCDSGDVNPTAATTMPTTTFRPQAPTPRLPAIVTRPQALARHAASRWRATPAAGVLRELPLAARWRALPAATRWQAIAAALTGLLLLTVYVLTLQAAVERGEALRAQQRQQGVATFGAGTPPAGIQTASPSSTRS